jgi:hypothetical protein
MTRCARAADHELGVRLPVVRGLGWQTSALSGRRDRLPVTVAYGPLPARRSMSVPSLAALPVAAYPRVTRTGAGDAGGDLWRVAAVDDRAGARDCRVQAGRRGHLDEARAADDRAHVAGGELTELGLAVAVDRDVEPVRAAILEPPSSGWPTPRDRAGGRRRPVPRPAHGAWPGPGLRAWCCH